MSWLIWTLVAWGVLSLPLGLLVGRAMARMNPHTPASDEADWQQIRSELAGMMPGGAPAPAPSLGWPDMESEIERAPDAAADAARKVA